MQAPGIIGPRSRASQVPPRTRVGEQGRGEGGRGKCQVRGDGGGAASCSGSSGAVAARCMQAAAHAPSDAGARMRFWSQDR
ncbi:hypothetical protein VE03_02902 [Pseudogymnoascus sp. 23342-1-I1]|nr:hypothetical protein VE03_02902 [Pseudogymnoascus sp. 23342-1-I1]